ncbi:hypothetical protein BBW65_00675 [Helicobacter enhydrae]|uniref:VWFA domain-containing protein n=1 Tax=Helicobacter enhydrae TaxID=222136 RepID=A0A1B1U3T3_9HELI|nr:VWA domain-containing protein [Helicobacter enhydrae]ANV97420.1 hypothetical protein BBW65_00675 [Helicobacter enhydrae]
MQEPTQEVVVDEKLIKEVLKRLIDGASCAEIEPSKIISGSNLTYVTDKQVVDATKLKGGIVFDGNILRGGIYEEKNDYYVSDTRDYIYALKGSELEVKAICSPQSFVLQNFDVNQETLGIKLSKKPTKEIGIVVCATQSMSDCVFALKEIAPFLSQHLFGDDKDAYAKVVLVRFTWLLFESLGVFYQQDSFAQAINKLSTTQSDTRMLYRSLIEAMRYFTKDNGLEKEIYLISDGSASDPHNEDQALQMTQNLNFNIAKGEECGKNCVKIHSFNLGQPLDFLKNLSKITGGNYYYADNIYNFKKNILTQSSGGKFDMRELDVVIHPSKTHKMHDDFPQSQS